MINGILVERTVGDVLPALQTNADGLKKVLEDLVKQYRSKQDEMEKWKVCNARTCEGPRSVTKFYYRRRTRYKLCNNDAEFENDVEERQT